jgi:hypothetical protein
VAIDNKINNGVKMLYSSTPYHYEKSKDTLILHTLNGVFIVEDLLMVNLICKIHEYEFIELDTLKDICNAEINSNYNLEDIIKYLTEETEILIKLSGDNNQRKEIIFIDIEKKHTDLLNILFKNSILVHNLENYPIIDNSLIIVLFSGFPDKVIIEKLMLSLTGDQMFICVFQVAEFFVISPVWSISHCLPCPLCTYDYAMDNIYADRTNKISGFADTIDHIKKVKNIKLPGLALKNDDYAYALRFTMQYADTIIGKGRGLFSSCSPDKMTIINTFSLDKTSFFIPFSFLCNCINIHINKKELNDA